MGEGTGALSPELERERGGWRSRREDEGGRGPRRADALIGRKEGGGRGGADVGGSSSGWGTSSALLGANDNVQVFTPTPVDVTQSFKNILFTPLPFRHQSSDD